MPFLFEKLDVYVKALDWIGAVNGVIEEKTYHESYAQLETLSKMLSGLISSVESRPQAHNVQRKKTA